MESINRLLWMHVPVAAATVGLVVVVDKQGKRTANKLDKEMEMK